MRIRGSESMSGLPTRATLVGLAVSLLLMGCGGGEEDSAASMDMTPEELVALANEPGRMAFGGGQFMNPNIAYNLAKNSFWALQELEKLGVTMRWDDGDYRICVFGMGRPCLRVHWQNVKPEMAAAVRKRGVNVLERTMVVDLLTNNNAVTGATAVNTRTRMIILIE